VDRKSKRGAIPLHVTPILERLEIEESTWLDGIKLFGRPMFRFIGTANRIRQVPKTHQRCDELIDLHLLDHSF